MKILLLSDTHSYLDPALEKHAKAADEIWHAGDIGEISLLDELRSWGTVRAVYGNIDASDVRQEVPEHNIFEVDGLKVWMTHIGGYPPKYRPEIKKELEVIKPGLFICGHSHILKAIPDKQRRLIHLNPGAAGVHGFHKIRTAMRFEIDDASLTKLEVVELGLRGKAILK